MRSGEVPAGRGADDGGDRGPPDDDLAVLAGVQGVLIEILEARNSELAAALAAVEERLARLERAVSRNSELRDVAVGR